MRPDSVRALRATQLTVPASRSKTLLQRKCACGGTSTSGECEHCSEKAPALQRQARSPNSNDELPRSVREVLRSPGQPLDAATQALFEPRFSHNFANVLVHADSDAAASAKSVHALAYTAGHHIVFAAGQYRPGTTEGNRLTAHELAHVLQQTGRASRAIQRQAAAPDVADDSEAPVAEEDGSGTETDESSTEDEIATSEKVDTEETTIQTKAAGWGAAPELPHLEQVADRAADDALSGYPVSISVGVGSAGVQRTPQTRAAAKTFIQNISVDLTSPAQPVTLTWTGPSAAGQPTGPFHSSPGAGCCNLDCDDEATSRRDGSHCTPKGTGWDVGGHTPRMSEFPEAQNVTWFSRNGIALHYYPSVPKWPASHGCVRLPMDASRIIYDNSVTGTTKVDVVGTWTRHDHVCWNCSKKKGAKK
jgi:Domain of unknown function (DUF4157)/L,D-transpeptidase catalytic domain